MRKYVLVAVLLGVLGLVGCGRIAPAAVKAVAGQGAKAVPKSAVQVAPAAAAAARPAREGGLWKELGKEGMQQGVKYGLKQLGGDDKKSR